MKLQGQTIPPPEPVKVTFFRGKDKFEFTIGAILDYTEFDKMVPFPKAPLKMSVKEKKQTHNFDDKRFLASLDKYTDVKAAYMVVFGLKHTEGLEWDTVRYDEPDTWVDYEAELKKFLTEAEVQQLTNAVRDANNPSSDRAREAFNSFTPSQAEAAEAETSSQKDELPATESGELAKGSE